MNISKHCVKHFRMFKCGLFYTWFIYFCYNVFFQDVIHCSSTVCFMLSWYMDGGPKKCVNKQVQEHTVLITAHSDFH